MQNVAVMKKKKKKEKKEKKKDHEQGSRIDKAKSNCTNVVRFLKLLEFLLQ